MGERPSELSGTDPLTDEMFDESETEVPVMTDAYAETAYTAVSRTDSDGLDPTEYDAEFDTSESTDEPDLAAQREEIERTRADMSEKINAIQDKLSPSNITNQAKEAVRDATVGRAQHVMDDVSGTVSDAVSGVADTAGDLGGGFVEVIRENPIPAALAGLGIGWLFMSYRNRQSGPSRGRAYTPSMYPNNTGRGYTGYVEAETRYPYRDYRSFNNGPIGSTGSDQGQGTMQNIQGKVGDVADQAQNTASDIAGRAQDTMSQAQDTASQWANQAQDTASQLASQAQNTAGQFAGTAQYQAQRATSQLDRLIHERPLAVGLGAFGIGLAVGLAIPETPQEDQWMGETRETVMDRAQQAVQQTAQKVSAVAGETLDAAKDTVQQTATQAAQEQGLTGSDGQSGSSGSPTQVEFTPESSVDTATDLSSTPTEPQPASRSRKSSSNT